MKDNFRAKSTRYWITVFIMGVFSVSTLMAQNSRIANTDHIKRKWLDIAYATASTAQQSI